MGGAARREVIHGDALAWLREHRSQPGCSVVTSMPDVSELRTTLPKWRAFFAEAATLALQCAADDGLCVFFQTDIKVEGRWISKAAMVLNAAEAMEVPLLWHKVVLRRDAGEKTYGRPGYAHLLAFSRTARDDVSIVTADVLPSLGEMPWSHSMGAAGATEAVRAIRVMAPTTTRVIVPFCGVGTALAVANEHGLDATGIEKNGKRAEIARTLALRSSEESTR